MGSKWFSKIGIALTGIAMAVGVGVGLGQKEFKKAEATTKTDTLTTSDLAATGNAYTAFSNVSKTSNAKYAGKTSIYSGGIGMRSSNNDTGIVSTTSGGIVKTITVVWSTTTARTINVYGKDSAYSSAANLFSADENVSGDLVGTIVYGTSTSYTFESNYAYFGIRSSDSTLSVSSIEIVWEESQGPQLTKLTTPVPTYDSVNNKVTWSADANADHYSVNINGAGWINATASSYHQMSELSPSTKYTVQVKAVAPQNSQTYTDSNVASTTFYNLVHTGSEADPYSVADALVAPTAEGKYVSGIISSITEVSVSNGNATYSLSDDGTTTTEILIYRGKYLENVAFTAEDQIKVGAEATVTGNITVYNSKNQFAQNNYLTSYTAPQDVPATSITLNSSSSVSIQCDATSQISAAVDEDATDKRLTYVSSTPAVATVSASGLITGVEVGNATITVASYSTPEVSTTVSVTVSARTLAANKYSKVKRQSELVAGEKYILVYESSSTAGNAFSGDDVVNGNVAVTISNGEITPTAQIDAGAIIIDTMEGGYYLKVCYGDKANKYMAGKNGNNQTDFNADETLNTIVIESGVATITSDTSFIQFNSSNNQMRFRYYKSGTTTQKDISLYRYQSGTLTTDAFATYFKDSTTTICGANDTSANHFEALNSIWTIINAKFNELSSSDKTSLATAEALEGGTNLQDALARYDHMMVRYRASELTDFIGRFAEGGINYSARGFAGTIEASDETTNTVIIAIIIIASVSALAVGGYFFIRRKHQ